MERLAMKQKFNKRHHYQGKVPLMCICIQMTMESVGDVGIPSILINSQGAKELKNR
jgi:hypothetical protein